VPQLRGLPPRRPTILVGAVIGPNQRSDMRTGSSLSNKAPSPLPGVRQCKTYALYLDAAKQIYRRYQERKRSIRTATWRFEISSRTRHRTREPCPGPNYSKACCFNFSSETVSSTASLVASRTTGGTVVAGTRRSRTASRISTHHGTQTHHRSPDFSPGKSSRGRGVVRSLPRSAPNARNLSVITAQDSW